MPTPLNIGSRRELFVDDCLIERLTGATPCLHPPVRREVVLEMNGPHECSTSYYYNLFRDNDRVRLYYRGLYGSSGDGGEGQTANLAESDDGIHFTRPALGVVDADGARDSNIVWRGPGGHNFHVFRDDNPAADSAQRYKAVASAGMHKLYGFCSPDGTQWQKVQEEPLLVPGAFDSLNVVFWDALLERYRLFSRYWDADHGVRAIQSCESRDFLTWSEPAPHQYADGVPWEQFYTNATVPCPGAEHILLSFPKRFVPDRTKCTDGMDYPGDGLSDAVFMSSRDGIHWDRSFLEAWLRPGLDPRNWSHRNNLPACGIIETAPDEWSMYVGENYGWDTNRLRRVTLRPHGFASLGAGRSGGELLTRLLTFTGDRLFVNYGTSAAGSLEVALLDEGGMTLAESPPIFGDSLDAPVLDVAPWAGRPIRLRVRLQDADLFALRTGQ